MATIEIETRIRRMWIVKAAAQIAEFIDPDRGLRLLNWAAGIARPEWRYASGRSNWRPMNRLRFVRSSHDGEYEFRTYGVTEDGDE